MKFKYILFLPFLLMLAASCSKPKRNLPFPVPTGTFSGQFERLRLNGSTKKYDTLTTNITLTLDLSTGYKVIADTNIHADSHGNFSMDAANIAFDDFTYQDTVLPAKPHLLGIYQYTYNGTNLYMQQTYPNDTLGFFYNLTKQ